MKIRYISIENFRGIKSLKTYLKGDFICLIGHGDNCKSTICVAIEYALSPRWNINLDDSDFFNQDISNPITIAVTLADWNRESDICKKFFSESKFGQFICGLNETGPIDEPIDGSLEAITVKLIIDKTLEPKWFVVKGDQQKPLSSSDRDIFGIGRIDSYLDSNFTWGRNAPLAKLSSENADGLDSTLTNIARLARKTQLDSEEFNSVALRVKTESEQFGVKLTDVTPKIDVRKLSLGTGALSLHENDIPLRNLGFGSKKLISFAIQKIASEDNNITLIDELELGLEPHRIRGLIKKLKSSRSQVITTTHSPVVLRELSVNKHELYVCRRDNLGNVTLISLASVPDIQGPVRSNAEAFLGRKIVVCEGVTEIGCLRALDEINNTASQTPVWTLNTSYFNASGISNIKRNAVALKNAGYIVSVLCDNDEPTQFTASDKTELIEMGIKITEWESGNSIEQQLFNELPWSDVVEIFNVIANVNDSKNLQELIQSTCSRTTNLSNNISEWQDSEDLRKAIGLAAKGGSDSKNAWFKRMDYAESVFAYALTKLPVSSKIKTGLNSLWDWVQRE